MANEKLVSNYHKKIMNANLRLANLAKSFGTDSSIYQSSKQEIENFASSMGLSGYIYENPKTGAIKLSTKSAFEFAHMRRNERSMFNGIMNDIKTVGQIKKETARQLGKSAKKITTSDVEAYFQMKLDFKATIAAFYALLEGSGYREILLPELYNDNSGGLDERQREKISNLISYYAKLDSGGFLKTASVEELERIRKEAEELL